jgi:hypothetical protein
MMAAKIQYQKMIEAGIFYLSPKSLTKTVNEIWDSVEYRCNQESIRIVREDFLGNMLDQANRVLKSYVRY